MRPVIGLLLVSLLSTCYMSMPHGQLPVSVPAGNDIVVFLTGNELGWLKPCGCSGGQLGGLNRRAALLDSVVPSRRLIVETGDLIPEASEQMLIKFNIFLQAFQILGYDLLNLTAQDLDVVQQLGLLEELKGQLNLTRAGRLPGTDLPDTFSRSFSIGGRTLDIHIKALDRERFDEHAVKALFGDPAPTNRIRILIVNGCDEAFAKSLAGRSLPVDCIVCPVDMEEPEVLSEPGSPCLLVSVGRKGRYVGKLMVSLPAGQMRPELSFVSVPVSEDLPANDDMTALYATYQDIVKASNLLDTYRRVPLDDDLWYTGSVECRTCHEHEEAYDIWKTKGHSHAYATLEKVGSQYDPECIICHVVGMEYECGFINAEETDFLKDVGCEVCHGPGSEHIRTEGKAKTVGPKKTCLDCHTPEHSAGYEGHEQEFREKIRHWEEPNDVKPVKEGVE